MASALSQRLAAINARMAELTEMAGEALRGQHSFGVDEARQIREPLTEMEAMLAEANALRSSQPEVAAQLDLYKSQLLELQKTVERLRVTLIVRKTGLEAARGQLSAASRWCDAFRQTR
jgi:hypothetical protein